MEVVMVTWSVELKNGDIYELFFEDGVGIRAINKTKAIVMSGKIVFCKPDPPDENCLDIKGSIPEVGLSMAIYARGNHSRSLVFISDEIISVSNSKTV